MRGYKCVTRAAGCLPTRAFRRLCRLGHWVVQLTCSFEHRAEGAGATGQPPAPPAGGFEAPHRQLVPAGSGAITLAVEPTHGRCQTEKQRSSRIVQADANEMCVNRCEQEPEVMHAAGTAGAVTSGRLVHRSTKPPALPPSAAGLARSPAPRTGPHSVVGHPCAHEAVGHKEGRSLHCRGVKSVAGSPQLVC